MSRPDLSKLRRVQIEDYALLSSHLSRYQTPRSAYNIVNLMIWGTQFKAQWMEFAGRLIIFNETWMCVLMPLGMYFPPDELIEISEAFCESKKCGTISLIDNEYMALYRDSFTNFEITKDYNTADYIYLTEKLASLRGKKLQKKKNLISQFRKRYGDYEVTPLQKEASEECFDFADQWYKDHPEDKDEGYQYERGSLQKAFEYFELLKLAGLIIRHNRKMIAFTIYSQQSDDMVNVHFEKFDREMKGAAQLINWETAKHLQDRYLYVNREEDMGVPGLRKSKRSYQPLMVLDSYRIKKNKPKEKKDQ